MTPSDREAARQRIARARRRRGLSQAVLAGLIGRSESWLSQVERGKRGVDSHSVLVRLAEVLRVDLEELTSPKNSQASETRGRAESLKEAPADQLVVRIMALEEERLARRQNPELAGTAGLPEIDLRHLWPACQEPVPVVIGHSHVRRHTRYCAPPPDPRSGNPAITPQPANRRRVAGGLGVRQQERR